MTEILVKLPAGIWHKRGSSHHTECHVMTRDVQNEKTVTQGKYQHIPHDSLCPDCFVEPNPYYGLVFSWGGLLRSRVYGSATHKSRFGYAFQKPHGFTVRQAAFVSKESAVHEMRLRALGYDQHGVIDMREIHTCWLGGGTLFCRQHKQSGGATAIYYPAVEIEQGPTVIYGIRGNAVVAEAMKHIKAINEQ